MKNRSKKSSQSRRNALFGACLLLVIVAAGAVYAVRRHSAPATDSKQASVRPTNSVDYSAAPKADNNANEGRKSSSTPSTTLNNSSTTTPDTTPTNFTVQMSVSGPNNGNVHVGSLVNGTSTGTCTLTATQSGKAMLQLGTSSVAQDVNAYDCGVFNIPTSRFSSGTWKLTLTVSNNGTKASDSANVTI